MIGTLAMASYKEFKRKYDNLIDRTRENVMPTPHKHAEFIKAWADGQEVQVMTNSGWADVALMPSWLDSNEYRIKPAAPKWPQTTMTEDQLAHDLMWLGISPGTPVLRPVADKALKNAVETGQVVPIDVHDEKIKAEGSKWLAVLQSNVKRERELGEALHKATMALATMQESERKGLESLEISNLVKRHLADAKQALFYGFRLDDMSRDQLLAMAFQGWKRVEELSFPDYSKLLNESDQKIESFRKRAERDMAVAKAVRSGIRRWSAPISDDDLQRLIDTVK